MSLVDVTKCVDMPQCFMCSWRQIGASESEETATDGSCRITFVAVDKLPDGRSCRLHGGGATDLFWSHDNLILNDFAEWLLQTTTSNNHNTFSPLQFIALCFAIVLVAVFCHKEVSKAHTLARVVMTHTGCLPTFFQPLSIVVDGTTGEVSHSLLAAAIGKILAAGNAFPACAAACTNSNCPGRLACRLDCFRPLQAD